MSTAPRPHSAPSRSAAPNGSNDQRLSGPGGYHVGMAGKAQIGPAGAAAGIEVVDLVAAVAAAEDQAVAGEAEAFKSLGDDRERTLVLRRDARPADQLGRRVDRPVPQPALRSSRATGR